MKVRICRPRYSGGIGGNRNGEGKSLGKIRVGRKMREEVKEEGEGRRER